MPLKFGRNISLFILDMLCEDGNLGIILDTFTGRWSRNQPCGLRLGHRGCVFGSKTLSVHAEYLRELIGDYAVQRCEGLGVWGIGGARR